MRRRVSQYLVVFFAAIVCGPAVWGGEKPSTAKTGTSDAAKYQGVGVNSDAGLVGNVTLDGSLGTPLPLETTGNFTGVGVNSDAGLVGNVTLDESVDTPVPEATKGKITVAWKNGQLCFPDTSEKASGLRLQCSGNVMIEGKGITAKVTNLDVTITGQDSLKKAAGLSFRCAGGVRIEWKGMTMDAADLKYDGEKCLLTLSGDKSRPCILRQKNSDGTGSVLIAKQISLSSCGRTVECVGMTELRTVETFSNISSASGPAYFPPAVPAVAPAPYGTGAFPSTYSPPASPGSAPAPSMPAIR